MPNPMLTITWGAPNHENFKLDGTHLDQLTNEDLLKVLARTVAVIIEDTQAPEDLDIARAYFFTQFTAQIEDEQ